MRWCGSTACRWPPCGPPTGWAVRCRSGRRDLWSVFNRTQENLTKGGLSARAANGRRQTTRPVQGIDQSVRLNRALWLLADGLRQLKA